MPIIIKEMVVRTTVEKSATLPAIDSAAIAKLKTSLLRDMGLAQERKNSWKKER